MNLFNISFVFYFDFSQNTQKWVLRSLRKWFKFCYNPKVGILSIYTKEALSMHKNNSTYHLSSFIQIVFWWMRCVWLIKISYQINFIGSEILCDNVSSYEQCNNTWHSTWQWAHDMYFTCQFHKRALINLSIYSCLLAEDAVLYIYTENSFTHLMIMKIMSIPNGLKSAFLSYEICWICRDDDANHR